MRGIRKKPVSITITGTLLYSSEEQSLLDAVDFLLPEEDTDPKTEKLRRLLEKNASERRLELCTPGEMSVGHGQIELAYDESALTGMEGSRTRVFVRDDGLVTLMRQGKYQTHLVFEDGKRHMLCPTRQNAPSVCVSCSRIKRELSENGGELDIDYSVEVGGALAEQNAYTIRVEV